MQIEQGMIVKSKAGRDSNRYFVVLRVDESGFAWIADGKCRTLQKPKRKNGRHLGMTGSFVDLLTLDTDKKIRNVLWDYNYGTK